MKQLIQNITTSFSLPRALARRLVFLLAVLLVGVGEVWAGKYKNDWGFTSHTNGAKYYIFNKSTKRYLKDNSKVVENEDDATLWFVNNNSIASTSSRYVNVSSYFDWGWHVTVSSNESSGTLSAIENKSSYYQFGNKVKDQGGYLTGSSHTHFVRDNGGSIGEVANGSQGADAQWIFIPEATWENAKPKFQFKANAYAVYGGVKSDTGGTASVKIDNGNSGTSVVVTKKNKFSTSTMTASATFTAVLKSGYVFKGWSTSTSDNDIVYTGLTYTPEPMSVNSSVDHTEVTTITLYAIFGDKYVPVVNINNGDDENMLVGETLTFGMSNVDEITYNITETQLSPSIHSGNDVITYNSSTKTLTACNAGTAKITFHQAATSTIQARDIEFNIVVSKRSNTIFINNTAGSYSKNDMTYADSHGVTIASTNASGPDRVVTQTSGSTIASYSGTGTGGTITTYFTSSSASWNVTQPEDYKYQAASATITVNVDALDEEECNAQTYSNVSLTTHINSINGEQTSPMEIPVEYKDLCFKVSHQSGAVSDYMYVEFSKDDGSTWPEVVQITGWSTGWSQEKIYPIPNGVTHFRFNARRYSTLSHYFKDIHITRKTDLRAVPYSSNLQDQLNPLDFGTTLENNAVSRQFFVDWSSSNTGDIYLSCDNPHFTISPRKIDVESCSSRRTLVTVTYLADEHPTTSDITHSGTITIYDKGRVRTITVTGTTRDKYNLIIEGSDKAMTVEQDLNAGFVFRYDGNENAVDKLTHGNGSSHFYYTIANTLNDNIIGCDPNHTGDVVTYNPATNQFHAWNAGTAVITFHEKGNDEVYARADTSFTVTVTKHDPSFTWNSGKANQNTEVYFNHNATHNNIYSNFVVSNSTYYNTGCVLSTISSSNPEVATVAQGTEQYQVDLSTYNDYTYRPTYSAQSTDITITQAENYYWKSKNETKSVTPSVASNHVELTINNQAVYDAVFDSRNTDNNHYNTSQNAIQLGDITWGGLNYDDKITTIHFEGIPDSVSFQAYTSSNSATFVDFRIYESSDGADWGNYIWQGTEKTQTVKRPLQPTTRYLRLVYSGNFGGYYKNVKITELHKFKADTNRIDFGKVSIDEHPARLLEFSHANAGYTVTAVSSSSAFSISPTIVPNTGGDKVGDEYHQVTFQPSVPGLYNGTITFRDQIGNSFVVYVEGEATNDRVPKFTWNPLNRPYYCSSDEEVYAIPNIFSTTNGDIDVQITYDPNKLRFSGDSMYILISEPEELSVTFSQAAIGDWTSLSKTYTFNVVKRPNISVPFVVTEQIYNNRFEIVSSSGYKWDSYSGIKLGGNSTAFLPNHPCYDWSDKYVIFNFAETPDSLFFKYRTNWATSTYLSATSGLAARFSVLESSDGVNWREIWFNGRSESNSYASAKVALSPNTSYVKFLYQGNFAGYFYQITITKLDGYYFLMSGDKYMSRGGEGRNMAVVDDYGIAVRKTKSCDSDNRLIFTHLQHVDNYKYLSENGAELVTNSLLNRYFFEEELGDKLVYRSANDLESSEKKYVTTDPSNNLVLTTDENTATQWKLVTPKQHADAMVAIRDAQVITATTEFGETVESLAKLRGRLENEDYDRDTIQVFTSGVALQQKEAEPNNNRTIYSTTINDLDTGLYRLNVKAFYRISGNSRAYRAYKEGYDCPVAYVRMVDNSALGQEATTQIGSVYEYRSESPNSGADFQRNGFYYPNDLVSAKINFEKNFVYDNDVYLFVHANPGSKASVTLSIESPSNASDTNWLCYKDITLTRLYRKEFTFDGKVDSVWNNGANWEYEGGRGIVPEKMHKVKIAAPAVVKNGNNVGAYKITFDPDKPNSSIKVEPSACLSVREGGFEGDAWNKLVLEADETGKTGALLLHPEMEVMPNATVQFYSTIANKKTDTAWLWQYIGTPIKNPDTNEHILYQCWLYQYSIEDDEWTNAGNWGHMKPFLGYAFTRDNYRSTGPLFGFCGQLNDAKRKELPLYYVVKEGKIHNENQIANSWTAPIRISNLEKEDFNGVEQTIYYYPRDGKGSVTSIAPFTAEYTGSEIIPAMQGFFVKATEGAEHALTLDYKRLVWEFEKEGAFKNEPLKAPSREKDTNDELLSRVCINLMSADSIPDQLYLIEKEGEGFSRDFTEGYDAPKYFVDGLPCIYTYETSGTHLAVSATDDVVGTYLAINTNASQNYTLTFSKVIGEGLGLRDLVTNTIVPITEGMQYAFTAPANSSPMLRFVVVEYEETPQRNNNNGTSLEDVGGEFKIWQSGEILSVIGAGSHASLRLYDAAGKLILSEFFNEATAINLNALPTGVYMVQVNDKTEKVLR